MQSLRIETPRWALPLLEPSRYKAAYGGRGSGKSHFFAELLIERCVMQRTRAVCVREVQRTIRDSVRQLLVDKIEVLGLGAAFEALETEIRGPNGSLIIFRGMQSYNASNIKSLEGYDIAWVEEAQDFSAESLKLLRPTIREKGSELWFSWNPRHETDAVDKFFRGGQPPADTLIVPVNWNDNPWFPPDLAKEKDEDFARDPEAAEHVWNGAYESVSEASYYAKWISAAEGDGRIYRFDDALLKRLAHRPLMTSWDLGYEDYTAIWFWKEDGVNAYVLDFYETSQDGPEDVVRDAIAPSKAWAGPHYLPHDGASKIFQAGGRSVYQQLTALGLRRISVGTNGGPEARIPATRALLPLVHFNDVRNVQVGLSHLRRYSRKFNQQLGIYQGPLHDEHSHAADAFGEFAVSGPLRKDKPKVEEPPRFEVMAGKDSALALDVRAFIERRQRERRARE